MVMVHAFNPSTGEAGQEELLEFKTSLVHRMSFRTDMTTQRNPVLKNQNQSQPKQNKTRMQKTKQKAQTTLTFIQQTLY